MARSARELARETPALSSLPMVYARLTEALAKPRVSTAQIAKIIACDSALTARLLRLVNSAFYAFPSVAGLLGRTIRGHRPASALELAAVLLDEARVAVVPGEAFGCSGYARLSYALADDELTEGVRRLAEVLGETAS